ncbi:MAG TPA: SGNH/GDSL hydrolase family protein [Devosia sp.]|nr:SGNH/GDSL hydrolase family protein [Devosia sp.]
MAGFAEALRARGVRSIAVFGDSISVGLNATRPELSWPMLLAAEAGGLTVRHAAISGTILQGGVMADGRARPDHGIGRYRAALLGGERADAIALLYGYNDGRYVAAPQSLNAEGFRRDYAAMIEGLLVAGYAPEALALGSPPYPSDAGFAIGSAGFTGQTRAGFERFVAVAREIAGRYGLYYAPVYEAMAAYPDGALASDDVTHPNDLGHWVIAGAFGVASQ